MRTVPARAWWAPPIFAPDTLRAAVRGAREDGAIATSINAEGSITFDPPGVSVELAAFFEE